MLDCNIRSDQIHTLHEQINQPFSAILMPDDFYDLSGTHKSTVDRISRKLLCYECYLRVPYLIGLHLFVIVNARERFQVITEDKCATQRPLVFVSVP